MKYKKTNITPNCRRVFSLCNCFSLLQLYIPNTVDTLSLASANDNYGDWLKEQFCKVVYLAEFSVQ